MTFNPKESIDFNGNTGPFIQYTYARIQSVLRKAAENGIVIPEQLPLGVELSEKEEGLIQMVADFAAIVKQAGTDYSPSVIANYTYDLVKEYNQFYKYGRRKDSIHSPQSQVADRRNAYPLFYIQASCQSVPARIKVS